MTGALPNLVTASVWCSSLVAFLMALARSSSGRVSVWEWGGGCEGWEKGGGSHRNAAVSTHIFRKGVFLRLATGGGGGE